MPLPPPHMNWINFLPLNQTSKTPKALAPTNTLHISTSQTQPKTLNSKALFACSLYHWNKKEINCGFFSEQFGDKGVYEGEGEQDDTATGLWGERWVLFWGWWPKVIDFWGWRLIVMDIFYQVRSNKYRNYSSSSSTKLYTFGKNWTTRGRGGELLAFLQCTQHSNLHEPSTNNF